MDDNDKMNAMIALSQIQLKEPSYKDWFSHAHQKQHIFNIAAKMVAEFDYEPAEAITIAQDFIDTFYRMKVDPKTRG